MLNLRNSYFVLQVRGYLDKLETEHKLSKVGVVAIVIAANQPKEFVKLRIV
jgi:hypothetical protein